MLSVPVQKDIGEYKEKVVLGLSGKSLLGLAIGICLAIAEACFCYFILHISIEQISIPVMLTVMAAFVFGFARPLNLPFTTALPLMASQYFGKTTITYASSLSLAQSEEQAATRKSETKEKKDVKHARETKKERKRYRKDSARRGRRSAEYFLPRYAAAYAGTYLGAEEALEEGAEGACEGAGA